MAITNKWFYVTVAPIVLASVLWVTLAMAAPSSQPSETELDISTGGLEDPLLGTLIPYSPLLEGEGMGAAEVAQSVQLELVGRWPYGASYDVVPGTINGTPYAFLGAGSVVQVLDMTDPTSPTLAGEIVTPGTVHGLDITGNFLLVADQKAGLRVIDLSVPASPQEVGSFDTPGHAEGVVVSGDLALVADFRSGLRVIDISDPSNPQEVGAAATPGSALGVAVSGDLALVADFDFGLRVIDVSNPGGPTEVGIYDTPGRAEGGHVP